MNDETKQRLIEIKKRLDAAKPVVENVHVHSVLGSGSGLCTAIVAEDIETGAVDFIADIFPEYVKTGLNNGDFIWISATQHIDRLKFFENVFDDIGFLLELLNVEFLEVNE